MGYVEHYTVSTCIDWSHPPHVLVYQYDCVHHVHFHVHPYLLCVRVPPRIQNYTIHHQIFIICCRSKGKLGYHQTTPPQNPVVKIEPNSRYDESKIKAKQPS